MAANGCSGGMDALMKIVNRLRGEGEGRPAAFTGCCDAHDLLYEQGTRRPGGTGGERPDLRAYLSWLSGRVRDIPWRAKADRLLRECVAANLKARNRPAFVRLHVPWCVWIFVRLLGWRHWGRE